MRIGIFEGSGRTIDDNVRSAIAVERDGFASCFFPQIFTHDALTLIALAGRETERIELGTSVIPVYPFHPFAFAQHVLSTQAATNGRLALGIGLSHQPVVEGMWGLSYEKPARHMREFLAVLLPLLTEGRVQHQGDVYRVAGGVDIPDATPPKVLLAALAPVMLRLAGEQTDGTITWMTGRKTIESHVAPRLNRAAEQAGRPQPRVAVALPVCVTKDPTAAREAAAQTFAIYGQLVNYRRMLDREGVEGPKDVLIAGTENEVEQELRALAAAGATDYLAVVLPSGDDPAKSAERTRELLKGLVGKI